MKCVASQCVAVILAGLCAGLIQSRAAEQTETGSAGVVARLHLGGVRQWGNDANGRVFKEIWSLPATVQLRNETLGKLAGSLAGLFERQGDGNANCAALLRPLLADVVEAECYFETVERPQNTFESIFAIKLEDARMRVWRTNWAHLTTEWRLRPALKTGGLSVSDTNSWFTLHFISGGSEAAGGGQLKSDVLRKIREKQRPVEERLEHWLQLEANLPRLSQWLAGTEKKSLPRITFMVVGRRDNLRSEGRLTFNEPLSGQVERWAIPMETIRDPLISFTAMQGFREWLRRQPLIQQLGLQDLPNQFFTWGLSQTAFQIQAAVPMADAPRAFERIAEKWVPKFNSTLTNYAVGNIIRLTDRPELVWKNLPLLVPYLNTVKEGNRAYLHAGIFPVEPPKTAAPSELFHQLTSETNLVYYDWEITEARLVQLRPLLQLGAVFLTVSPMSTNSTAFKWLDAVEPRLGNAVTEISKVSDREFEFRRTSHAGLNGLELLTLSKWLETTNFPQLNLGINFRPVIRAQKPAATP